MPIDGPGTDQPGALTWIIDNQVGSRNLSPIDKVPLVERKREILEQAAKERQEIGNNQHRVVENFPQGEAGKTRDKLAASIGVSGKTYESVVKTVNDGNPELVDHGDQVDTGHDRFMSTRWIPPADIWKHSHLKCERETAYPARRLTTGEHERQGRYIPCFFLFGASGSNAGQ